MNELPYTLTAALVLVAVHLFSGRLRFLEGTPRSRWLSVAGGISVAYVFLHLLPELAEGQEVAESRESGLFGLVESEIYLLALVGLLVFYGLERAVRSSNKVGREQGAGEVSREAGSSSVFWLHLLSFGLYNVITGYLLVRREEQDLRGLLVFAFAMALHFVVTDFGLRKDFRGGYAQVGRWVLTAAVLLGWGLGVVLELPQLAVLGVTAFLGGGVILNVLKEELPKERESRLSAFVLGTLGYAALLLVL